MTTEEREQLLAEARNWMRTVEEHRTTPIHRLHLTHADLVKAAVALVARLVSGLEANSKRERMIEACTDAFSEAIESIPTIVQEHVQGAVDEARIALRGGPDA